MARIARIVRFPAGSFLFQRGQKKSEIYAVLEGLVKRTIESDTGRRLILDIVRPGSLCGEASADPRGTFWRTAIAATDASVLAWRGKAIAEAIERIPRIGINLVGIFATECQKIEQRFLEMATEPVRQRLARMVLALSRDAKEVPGSRTVIDIPLSRQDLAEMTGTTLFTVSRILSTWERAGLVESARLQLVILDREALERVAHGG